MKYFGTFIFTHTHQPTRQGEGSSASGTARTKQLNESKTEMLPIYIDGAFFSHVYPYRFIRSKKKYLEMSKKMFIFALQNGTKMYL